MVARKVNHDEVKKFARENPLASMEQIAKQFNMSKSGIAGVLGRRPSQDRARKIMAVVEAAREVVQVLPTKLREAVQALDA